MVDVRYDARAKFEVVGNAELKNNLQRLACGHWAEHQVKAMIIAVQILNMEVT